MSLISTETREDATCTVQGHEAQEEKSQSAESTDVTGGYGDEYTPSFHVRRAEPDTLSPPP